MSAEHFVAAVLGAPYCLGAEGPRAYDCWGLVRAYYRQVLGVELPAVDTDSLSPLAIRHRMERPSGWEALAGPEAHAVALLSFARRPHHVGICVGAGLLHAVEGAGVVCQSASGLRLGRWQVLGYYRRSAP